MPARVLLFTGKGGVGKTTAAALACADLGLRTVVRVGPYRRAITLPDTLAHRQVTAARLEAGLLEVSFR